MYTGNGSGSVMMSQSRFWSAEGLLVARTDIRSIPPPDAAEAPLPEVEEFLAGESRLRSEDWQQRVDSDVGTQRSVSCLSPSTAAWNAENPERARSAVFNTTSAQAEENDQNALNFHFPSRDNSGGSVCATYTPMWMSQEINNLTRSIVDDELSRLKPEEVPEVLSSTIDLVSLPLVTGAADAADCHVVGSETSPVKLAQHAKTTGTVKPVVKSRPSTVSTTSAGNLNSTDDDVTGDREDGEPEAEADDDDDDEGVDIDTFRHSVYMFVGELPASSELPSSSSRKERDSAAGDEIGVDAAILEPRDAASTSVTDSDTPCCENVAVDCQSPAEPRLYTTEKRRSASVDVESSIGEGQCSPRAAVRTIRTIQRQHTMATYQTDRSSGVMLVFQHHFAVVAAIAVSVGRNVVYHVSVVANPANRKRQRALATRCSKTIVTIVAVERAAVLTKADAETTFGFHLIGQDPMIVSTVEPGASQVELTLLAGVLSRDESVCSGLLFRLKSTQFRKKWQPCWAKVKHDGFMYYFKGEETSEPNGAIDLRLYVVVKATEYSCTGGRQFCFKLVKYGAHVDRHYFCCRTDNEMMRWVSAINMVCTYTNKLVGAWMDVSSHNVGVSAMSIKSPECCGFLQKVGNHYRTWRRRYCVLKYACLYYYRETSSSTAKGVAHLHGYEVADDCASRKFGFRLIPPELNMRVYQFTADNETEFKRWKSAFSRSISRWVEVPSDAGSLQSPDVATSPQTLTST